MKTVGTSERMELVFAGIGTKGDVLPLLGLGEEMARRGHVCQLLANAPYDAQAYLTGHDPWQILELPGLTSRIEPEQLRSAARRYLRDDRYLEAVWAASPDPPSVGPVTPRR